MIDNLSTRGVYVLFATYRQHVHDQLLGAEIVVCMQVLGARLTDGVHEYNEEQLKRKENPNVHQQCNTNTYVNRKGFSLPGH